MYLVVGATGVIGGAICRQLAEAGLPVRALVRPASPPDAVARLRALEVQIVTGDLRANASLHVACRGVRAVFSTATAMSPAYHEPDNTLETVDWRGMASLIDTAHNAGAERIVYVSCAGEIGGDLPLRRTKRAAELYLRRSGLSYTVLRPALLMESWLGAAGGLDYGAQQATIYGAGRQPVRWVAASDVARLAAACRDHEAARNVIAGVGGPEALSPLEAVQVFEELAGQRLSVRHIHEAELWAGHAAAANDYERSLWGLRLVYASGDTTETPPELCKLIEPLTTVREYAAQALASTAARAPQGS